MESGRTHLTQQQAVAAAAAVPSTPGSELSIPPVATASSVDHRPAHIVPSLPKKSFLMPIVTAATSSSEQAQREAPPSPPASSVRASLAIIRQSLESDAERKRAIFGGVGIAASAGGTARPLGGLLSIASTSTSSSLGPATSPVFSFLRTSNLITNVSPPPPASFTAPSPENLKVMPVSAPVTASSSAAVV